MRYALAAATFVLCVISSGVASAATVDAITGKVSINRGGGFEVLAGPASAKPGDAVMAAPEGSAVIVYSDQCKVKVEPGTVMVIAQEEPCKVLVEGQYEPTGGSLKDEPVVVEDRTPYYLLGGVAVAVGVGCIIACGHDDDDASP